MDNLNANVGGEAVVVSNMGFFQKIAGVIFSPGKTMRSIAERPKILFPLLLAAFSQVIVYLVRYPLYQDFMAETLKKSMEIQKTKFNIELTPQQVDQALQIQSISSLVATPIMTLLVWLIGTAVVYGLLKAFKGQGKFKSYLAVTGYAYIITLLYQLIVIAVSFFTGSLYLMVPLTSLASLLPADMAGTFLFGVIKGIDLFSIWFYAVIAIGLAEASKVKKTTVYTIVGIVFALVLLIAGAGEMAQGMYM